jgi:DNA-binding transcriptional LysR family regulator
MDKWNQIELFVLTAELGNLTKSAETLGISKATATRLLTALEKRLNARLVERNTRGLSLTEVGHLFYFKCKDILDDLNEAESAASETSNEPTGTLRITSSSSFCIQYITPTLSLFQKRYPKIDVELVSVNKYLDLIESGIDIAIRTREFETNNNITVRKLAQTRRILAASPAYLEKNGVPKSIEELQEHKFLLYTYIHKPDELHFTRGTENQTIKVKSALKANDGMILKSAALDGLGILIQASSLIHTEVESGTLIPILSAWELPTFSINFAYRNRTHLPAKVRVFIDFMVEQFNHSEIERKWI